MTSRSLQTNINRRSFVASGVAIAGTTLFPKIALAQEKPVVISSLTPLTGAGGNYGPLMRDAVALVVDQVNGSGGLRGQQIKLISEDTQTNPESGVRAARKLIDIDKTSAIIGTWASSVTSAVAPLCWESGTFLTCVSGADSITQLPHDGYLVRTQPNTDLQGRKFGQIALEIGAKKIVYLGPQSPFAKSTIAGIEKIVAPQGAAVSSVIYDGQKTSYRSEVDQALGESPDTIVLGGFVADATIVLKELYRAGFDGNRIAFAFAITPELIAELPEEVVEDIYVVSPSPAVGSNSYKNLAEMLGKAEVDTYTCQVYDQANLVILAMAAASQTTGKDIRDNIRRVSQGDGPVVENVLDGLRELTNGAKSLNYDGVSGSCTFDSIGDIENANFRFERVKEKQLTLLKID